MNLNHYDYKKLVIYVVILFLIESYILDLIKPAYESLGENLKRVIDISGLFGSLTLVYFFVEWYDKKLWKHFPSWINLVSVPDLNGFYTGDLISSHTEDGNRVQKKCEMTITQRASDIVVEMRFTGSDGKPTESRSNAERIIKNRNGSYTLLFVHENKGNYDDTAFNMHRGLTELKYDSKELSLIGSYFNDPHRKTHGELKLKKKK